MTNWDYIFVGSGISALTYVALLLKKNPELSVLILEQHTVPGGYSSEFRRPKQSARFDCSLHRLTGMSDNGNLRTLFRDLDLEEKVDLRFSPVWFDISGPMSLLLESDPEKTRKMLMEVFPDETVGLQTFFDEVALHGRNSYMQLEIMLGRYEPNFKDLRFAHRHLKKMTVQDALQVHFRNPQLIELLAFPSVYAGAFPEQCAYLYYLHVVYASLYQRSAYMIGGSQKLSNLLVQQIVEHDSQIVLNVDVQQVLIDPVTGLACGVDTDRGRFLGKKVIINADPCYAINNLLPQLPELAECKHRLEAQVPANSTITIYLVLRKAPENIGLNHAETILLSEDPNAALKARELSRKAPKDADLAEEAYWHRSSFEVTNYHVLDASGGIVVVINALDDIQHWPERKTTAYRQKKKRAAEVLIKRLAKAYPDLMENIAYQEVSSPRTYQRYTNNTAGSGYGALVSPNAKPARINSNFPIRNVSFLSAWISGSGYEATMGYARMLALSAQAGSKPSNAVKE